MRRRSRWLPRSFWRAQNLGAPGLGHEATAHSWVRAGMAISRHGERRGTRCLFVYLVSLSLSLSLRRVCGQCVALTSKPRPFRRLARCRQHAQCANHRLTRDGRAVGGRKRACWASGRAHAKMSTSDRKLSRRVTAGPRLEHRLGLSLGTVLGDHVEKTARASAKIGVFARVLRSTYTGTCHFAKIQFFRRGEGVK